MTSPPKVHTCPNTPEAIAQSLPHLARPRQPLESPSPGRLPPVPGYGRPDPLPYSEPLLCGRAPIDPAPVSHSAPLLLQAEPPDALTMAPGRPRRPCRQSPLPPKHHADEGQHLARRLPHVARTRREDFTTRNTDTLGHCSAGATPRSSPRWGARADGRSIDTLADVTRRGPGGPAWRRYRWKPRARLPAAPRRLLTTRPRISAAPAGIKFLERRIVFFINVGSGSSTGTSRRSRSLRTCSCAEFFGVPMNHVDPNSSSVPVETGHPDAQRQRRRDHAAAAAERSLPRPRHGARGR